ncbi:Methyltransferase domain family protein [marine gamma proteobacterium HTCC2148]|nr:Methyltransferase domain family protein [marine gamma proteobacterium HTCC2148]
MNPCPLCKSKKTRYLYNIEKFKIYKCVDCKSSSTSPPPSDQEIEDYYNGFYLKQNTTKKLEIFRKKYFRAWYEQFDLPKKSRMLDIGGGGGFYCWSFEYFLFGEAHYVDVDPQSCEFARNELRLDNVHNCFAQELPIDQKYDLIVCRHVIEHLVNPEDLINTAIDLLAPDGTLVLVTPNASSIEVFGYPGRLNRRVNAIVKATDFSRLRVLWSFLSGSIANSIYPIRHLHAISKKSVELMLIERNSALNDITYSSLTAHLCHAPIISKDHLFGYSPFINEYKISGSRMFGSIKTILVNLTLGKLCGGIHLIFLIKKNETAN